MELESNSNNINLDSSKKGTATVNYIRGNTLVNCAKENKELILNDEINVEGTTCTINDTVEGGLVDVELEGLSLNNIHPSSQYEFGCNSVNMGRFVLNKGTDKINIVINENLESWYYCDLGKVDVNLLKPNTKYTLIFSNASGLTGVKLASGDLTYQISNLASIKNNMAVITTNDMSNLPSNPKGICVYTSIVGTAGTTVNAEKVMILEGDYTNKPIPTEAFTGIKSVGEEVALTNISNKNGYYSLDISITNGSTNYSAYSGLDINKTYTVKAFGLDLESMTMGVYNSDGGSVPIVAYTKTDTIAFKPISSDGTRLYFKADKDKTISCSVKIVLVEGDYENSNLEYFEGSIKKYKIETKSQNKNLFKITKEYNNYIESGITVNTNQDILTLTGTVSTNVDVHLNDFNEFISLNKGKYILSKSAEGGNVTGNLSFALKTKEGATIWRGGVSNEFYTIDNSEGEYTKISHIRIHLKQGEVYENTNIRVQLEKSDSKTLYIKNKQHKKVILLDEPLRGIEGRAKDLIAKIENKYYEKRVCAEVVLNGDENWTKYGDLGKCLCFYYKLPNQHGGSYTFINDKLKSIHSFDDIDHIHINDAGLHITIEKTKLETQDVEGFKKWLKANPVTVVYKLATPIYEEIKGLNNEYPTYAEVTHISTNTVIPCNQKIQNTGIECMLKPSTLYSIHDIKTGSGVAKYNLGGTVNTSNKITTGATLTDNYLRLYGKGLTSKDVEVFEGDTPQTPYFSGMLSAFEDKLITQEMVDGGLEKAENLGKYRVGITVRGKNLFDNELVLGTRGWNEKIVRSSSDYVCCAELIECKPNTTYCFSGNAIKNFLGNLGFYNKNKEYLGDNKQVYQFNKFTTPKEAYYFAFHLSISYMADIKGTLQLEEGTQATQYEDYKEYKTSILLGSPPTKFDEICVQDGQLGVLHNGGEVVYDGNEDWKLYNKVGNQTSVFYLNFPSNGIAKPVLCDLFSFYQQAWDKTHNREGITFDVGANRCYTQIYNIKLETEDEAGFKKWLQKNHCKVVYELAESYFEPLTPQLPRWVLDIFDNSTISIDTIIPVESKFTYTSYIPSITAMQETNKNQDDLINVSLCATDEMYMMLEPLLQSVPQTLQINERMMSKMGELYIAMVLRKLKNIDDVPVAYRDYVIAKLNK